MIAPGKEVDGKGMGDLLPGVGSRVLRGCSEAEGRGGDSADSTAPRSDGVEEAVSETETATEKEAVPGARSERTGRDGSRDGQGTSI